MDKTYLQLYLPLVFFIAIAVAIKYLSQLFSSKSRQVDYEINQRPLTNNELDVYNRIKKVIPSSLIIIPQVSYDKVLKVISSMNKRQAAKNKIDRKSLDFVIFREADFFPILAIELDDITHQWTGRREKDVFENDIFDKSGLNLLRIKYNETNNLESLKGLINSKISTTS